LEEELRGEKNLTQFGRLLQESGIESIPDVRPVKAGMFSKGSPAGGKVTPPWLEWQIRGKPNI
jgi:hypothetical protein